LGHGSGGRLTHRLIREVFLPRLSHPVLAELEDSAVIGGGARLAFTTDSFVVSPLEFTGGDIGKLAVCGTVNDLVMCAAEPLYMAFAFIVEEGLEVKALERIVDSAARTLRSAGVACVTGDFKVVEKGACDRLFITSSGIGRVITRKRLSLQRITPGDKVIVTGSIGEHGLAVLAGRQGLDMGFRIRSDCAPLNGLLIPLLKRSQGIHFMRDPTRGGLATTLNEITQGTGLGIEIEERQIPVSSRVEAAGELLGIDPLYSANEGKAVVIAEEKNARSIVRVLRRHPLGRRTKIIGRVVRKPAGRVMMNTAIGTQRLIDMLAADPLPRIC
jgi:hydrogenase expression/formation protein HypE